MSLRLYLRRLFTFVRHGAPIKKVYANITTLPTNEFLKGRVALITGGGSGIGYQIAKSYVLSGASVVIAGRNADKLSNACSQIELETQISNHVKYIAQDVSDVSSLENFFSEACSLFGPIDILVNNAGVNGGNLQTLTEDEFEKIMSTNLKGTVFLSKLVARYMIRNNIQGNILNIASAASKRPAISAYQISKWGIRGFTQGLARALAPYGIVVNAIAPGPTATQMLNKNTFGDIANNRNLIGRYATPEEVADMAVIMVSGMCRTVIGDVLFMSGGGGNITNEDVDYYFE